MRNTHVPLLKLRCDEAACGFECYFNQNNHPLIHDYPERSGALWRCPECQKGRLRYHLLNARFLFSLTKEERTSFRASSSR